MKVLLEQKISRWKRQISKLWQENFEKRKGGGMDKTTFSTLIIIIIIKSLTLVIFTYIVDIHKNSLC